MMHECAAVLCLTAPAAIASERLSKSVTENQQIGLEKEKRAISSVRGRRNSVNRCHRETPLVAGSRVHETETVETRSVGW